LESGFSVSEFADVLELLAAGVCRVEDVDVVIRAFSVFPGQVSLGAGFHFGLAGSELSGVDTVEGGGNNESKGNECGEHVCSSVVDVGNKIRESFQTLGRRGGKE